MALTIMERAYGQAGTLYRCSPVISILQNGLGWLGVGLALVMAAVTAVEALHHVKGAASVAGVSVAGAVLFALPLKYLFSRTRSGRGRCRWRHCSGLR